MNPSTGEALGKSGRTLSKNSKDLGTEAKNKSVQGEKNVKNLNAKQKLNTMLVGLTKPSVSQGKGSSRQSTRNANSVIGTPRQDYSGVYSIEDESEMMKKYKKLLGLLKEKNKEIKQLSNDKSELQSSLCMVEGELKILRREKTMYKSKEDNLSGLHDELQFEESSIQSYRNGEKSQLYSPTPIQSAYLYQKGVIDLSNGDIKAPPKQQTATNLLGVFGKTAQVMSDRSGKSWIGSIDTKALKKRKGSDNGDGSVDNQRVVGKFSIISLERNRQENSSRQRNENGSQKEKLSYLKEIDEEFVDKKRQNEEMLLASIGDNVRLQVANQRKKTRKGHLDGKEHENASVDDRVLLRDVSMETRSQSQLHGKHFGLNNSIAHGTTRNTSQEENRGNLDIGGALNDLKDRIKKLLVKRDGEDNTKAHMLYESLCDRFQKVV